MRGEKSSLHTSEKIQFQTQSVVNDIKRGVLDWTPHNPWWCMFSVSLKPATHGRYFFPRKIDQNTIGRQLAKKRATKISRG